MLGGGSWTQFASGLEHTLARVAAGRSRAGEEVQILSQGQLALPWLLGRHFDRSTGVTLTTRNSRNAEKLTLDLQRFWRPISEGNSLCAKAIDGAPSFLDGHESEVCLLVGGDYARAALVDWLGAHPGLPPAGWIETGRYDDPEQVVKLASDVTAVVAEHRIRHVRLFTTLPSHVLTLLAALLKHAISRVTFMEFRRDAPLAEQYIALDVAAPYR